MIVLSAIQATCTSGLSYHKHSWLWWGRVLSLVALYGRPHYHPTWDVPCGDVEALWTVWKWQILRDCLAINVSRWYFSLKNLSSSHTFSSSKHHQNASSLEKVPVTLHSAVSHCSQTLVIYGLYLASLSTVGLVAPRFMCALQCSV